MKHRYQVPVFQSRGDVQRPAANHRARRYASCRMGEQQLVQHDLEQRDGRFDGVVVSVRPNLTYHLESKTLAKTRPRAN